MISRISWCATSPKHVPSAARKFEHHREQPLNSAGIATILVSRAGTSVSLHLDVGSECARSVVALFVLLTPEGAWQ